MDSIPFESQNDWFESAPVAPRRSPRRSPLLSRVDRARYRTRHRGLAFLLGAYMEMWYRMVKPGIYPGRHELELLHRSFEDLLAADLDNVEAGRYPRDLLFSMPLGTYLRTLPEAILDQPRIYQRARRGRFDDLPASVSPESYPAYYCRNFHWQTDGWLSRRSARLYDISVELLFGGVADVMRRMALPPVVDGVRNVARPRVLDIACGTGRFLASLGRALPRGELVGVDLSPFYVAHARQETPAHANMQFMVENAESMSFDDGAFDAATSVFLFHELPKDVRRRVMREAYRVLRPGARFVICDAAQLEGSGPLRCFLERFPEIYHEPYFKGYLRDDLETALERCGFQVERSEMHFVSKVVVARRPVTPRRESMS